jgi:hypothetical protein
VPKPTPVPAKTRREIAMRIESGDGRNELARQYGLSTGVISKIAREHHLLFAKTGVAIAATQARMIDQWAARTDREDELLSEYLGLETTMRPDGSASRKEQRLSYALYNVNRHSRSGQRNPLTGE